MAYTKRLVDGLGIMGMMCGFMFASACLVTGTGNVRAPSGVTFVSALLIAPSSWEYSNKLLSLVKHGALKTIHSKCLLPSFVQYCNLRTE